MHVHQFSTGPSTFTTDSENRHRTSFTQVQLFHVNLIHLIIFIPCFMLDVMCIEDILDRNLGQYEIVLHH